RNSVETVQIDGGEECVVPVQIEQGILPGRPFLLVKFRDATNDQTPRSVQGLLLRGERGERDLSDFSFADPRPGILVIDRIRVLDTRPCISPLALISPHFGYLASSNSAEPRLTGGG